MHSNASFPLAAALLLAGSATAWAQGGPVGVCSLPPEPGPCQAAIPRWFHNPATGGCEMFVWGGCGGNANNFETLIECQQACVDVCELPPDPGPCEAIVPRWFHNAATGECEMFIWGGCLGNANNFETKLECLQACTPICTLPADSGPCDGHFPRWFFNAMTGDCEMFIWGGCEGNGNNFETKEACQAACLIPALIEPYSCVNPSGSLVPLSGGPLIGTKYTVGVDNPVGTSAHGSTALVAAATVPDPAFPCGTPIPGLGMFGPFGEVLIGIAPPNPVAVFSGEQTWTGPGSPVPVVIPIPSNPGLVGQVVYLQGVLTGAGGAKVTEGQKLTIDG